MQQEYSFTKKNRDDVSLLEITPVRKWFAYVYPSLIIFLSSLFLFYKYLLQIFPSIITSDLMRTFDIKAGQLGNLAAMYFYSYMITQLFVGVLLDKYSPRLLTSLAIFCCAVAAMFFATAESLWVAELSRLLMGIGTAFATISYMKMASIWFRPNQFAFVSGLLATAAMTGALCAQTPLAFLVQSIGWRYSLWTCAGFGVIIALLFYLVVRDKNPENIVHESQSITLKDIFDVLKNKQNWLLALYTGLCFSPVAVFGGLWGNPFLQEAYHLTGIQSAGFISFLFIGLALGGPSLGYLADRLKKQIWVMILGTLIALFALLFVIYGFFESTSVLKFLLFIFGFGTGSFMLGFSVGREINKVALAATVIALINTGDAVFSGISEPLVGRLLDLFWTGNMVNGVPHFSLSNYRIALSILPFNLIIALFFILWFHLRNYRMNKNLNLK